ncbi:MAG: hypothetical protein R3E48_17585 [Burkholderiaceae bacterium]
MNPLVAAIQQSARIALEHIGHDIRQAGYVGCNSNLTRSAEKQMLETVILPLKDPAITPVGPNNFTINAENAVRVFDASAGAAVWGGSSRPMSWRPRM